MKCPRLSRVINTRLDGTFLFEVECLKEACAWWNEAYSCCDFKEGVRALGKIEFYLKQISEKMPHK